MFGCMRLLQSFSTSSIPLLLTMLGARGLVTSNTSSFPHVWEIVRIVLMVCYLHLHFNAVNENSLCCLICSGGAKCWSILPVLMPCPSGWRVISLLFYTLWKTLLIRHFFPCTVSNKLFVRQWNKSWRIDHPYIEIVRILLCMLEFTNVVVVHSQFDVEKRNFLFWNSKSQELIMPF